MKLTPALKANFHSYVSAANGSVSDLTFLLDNLGLAITLDFSEQSLVELERAYWKYHEDGNFPEEFGNMDDFIELICRYLGSAIIRCTGGKWVQSREKNRRFGEPCIDGFGNQKWDRIYPVSLAKHFPELPRTNRTMPGVRNKKVLAKTLEKAIKVFGKQAIKSKRSY